MKEFTSNQTGAPDNALPTAGRSADRGKRATLAGLFSLIVPGIGQLYNRQPRKALLFALAIPVLTLVAVKTRVLFSFWGMVSAFTVLVGWRLFIIGQAAYAGWKSPKAESWVRRPRIVYLLVGAVLLVAAFYPSVDQFKRWSGYGAFRDPSQSMCPTICEEERFVADMNAYESRPPQRGDIVLLEHKSSKALFMKRVVGVPGDTVAPGPNDTVLINGKPLVLPTVCGTPVQENVSPAEYGSFSVARVSEGTFFVIGDNLGASFDSRIPEFGDVYPSQIRGKPVFLYWSRGRSRIGCAIR